MGISNRQGRDAPRALAKHVRGWLVGLAIVAVGVGVPACTSGIAGTGELEVVILGIPIGTAADVQVTGPAGYSRTLDASEALTGLAPGSYNVFALQAGPYAATQTSQSVSVPAEGRVYADVIYVDIASPNHECLPYAPTRVGVSTSSEWATPSTVDTHLMQTPADPGGGWIEVELTTDEPVEPWLTIRHTMDSVLYIASASASGSSEPHARRHVFEAYPSAPYEFTVYEDVQAPASQHPWPYEITWRYHSLMDCYEPNELINAGKRVPLGQTIQAYGIVGHSDNTPPTSAVDWYKFDLSSPQGVVLDLEMNPSNVEMDVQLYTGSGVLIDQATSTPGGLFSKDFGTLAATTWYLRFRPFTFERDANLYDGEAIPAHFTTPYQFRLQVY